MDWMGARGFSTYEPRNDRRMDRQITILAMLGTDHRIREEDEEDVAGLEGGEGAQHRRRG